ncbi:MAG: hypothetical protein IJG62_06395 [Synergistaceae bacterium]|nr:hypothetical protein [Synergistaceae bacterium]MBQ4419853.1 hypothetical protein [Synergistaceae bacterium]MBQ9581554.1 hypothetical protein [Synergistaceae bacterium]MBR0043289.1 hypothetical protein [Synergistaceae bacterium]MBR0098073.1 hypothetical protein [Synergistaceae bacterium]
MGDIKKANKFDKAVERLNDQEELESVKSKKVVQAIAGYGRKKKTEEKKVMPVYIPMSMFKQFEEINTAYGISNNAAINMLIRDYITDKKGILDNI